MKAIGYLKSLPINDLKSLVDIDLPKPVATENDLLIKIKAIAVNPADYKVRQTMAPTNDAYKVIGWDAVGEVIEIGEKASKFKVGDEVFYAGDITRQGCNAEYQLVDERLVGYKPKTLSNAEAAALPLTAITAWEILFDHLAIKRQEPNSTTKSDEVILVVGAAGGVGSIFIQLAKAITGATIIATASRQSSQQWVQSLGADYIVDHSKPLPAQINALNINQITHVASFHGTDHYFKTYAELLAPFGKIAMIDDPETIDVSQLKLKSLSLHWEFMFARSMFNATDIAKQGQLLNYVADLVDNGYIKTTIGKNLGLINAKNLRVAHQELEASRSIGKIVLENF